MIFVAKIYRKLKLLREFLKTGGIVKVNVSFTNPCERFVGKRVLVTGGSSGIGLGIAKAFLAEGAEVVICARNKERLLHVQKDIDNSRLHVLPMDISDVNNINKKLRSVSDRIGLIDIFCNCAGVSVFSGDVFSEAEYNKILDINTKGLFYMCKAEGEYLVENKIQGKIINITSKAGRLIQFDPYTVSKWGANSITLGLAKKLAPFHICVNGIAPGEVPTNITKKLQNMAKSDNQFTPLHATRRVTMVEEVAALALYLASDSANNIIGQIIDIDGGVFNV